MRVVNLWKQKRWLVFNQVSLIVAANLQPLGMFTPSRLLLRTIPIHLFKVQMYNKTLKLTKKTILKQKIYV